MSKEIKEGYYLFILPRKGGHNIFVEKVYDENKLDCLEQPDDAAYYLGDIKFDKYDVIDMKHERSNRI